MRTVNKVHAVSGAERAEMASFGTAGLSEFII